MANEAMKIKAEIRTEQGTRAVGRLRRTGKIPGSVNRIEGDTTLIQVDAHDFMMAMRGHANEQLLVSLDLDGKIVSALMREVQNDVLSGQPIHVDLGEIDLTKKIRVSIPLVLTGEPVGVTIGGGVLEHMLRTIEVDCLPTDIVESIAIDVSALQKDESMFVKDLKLAAAYTVVTPKDLVVAVVSTPEDEVVAAPAADGTAATPEVIAKGKKDEEGADGKAAAAKAPAKK